MKRAIRVSLAGSAIFLAVAGTGLAIGCAYFYGPAFLALGLIIFGGASWIITGRDPLLYLIDALVVLHGALRCAFKALGVAARFYRDEFKPCIRDSRKEFAQ